MTMNSSNLSQALTEAVTAVSIDSFSKVEPQHPNLFKATGSNKKSETRSSMSGTAELQLKAEGAAPADIDPTEQFTVNVPHSVYSGKVSVTREALDDVESEIPLMMEVADGIGESAVQKYEEVCGKVFVNSFSTSRSEDGISLCNASHENAAAGNTQSNVGSTGMTLASVGATRILMRKQKNYEGKRITIRPDILLGGPDQEALMWGVVRGSGGSGNTSSANLAENNFQNGRYTGIIWDELDSDTNDWWMLASNLMDKNLTLFHRVPYEVFGDGDLMSGVSSIACYLRFSVMVQDWRFIYGHQVA